MPEPVTEALPPAGPRQAAFAFIFVTVLLDMLALGVVLPVMPRLIESFLDGDTARAAHYVGIFGSVWALMQFLFSPVIGALSDRHGRRPIILLSNFGLAFNYVVMAAAPSLAWWFVGRVLSGITSASVSTANAYVADVTPPEQRAARFGLLGAAFGAGFVLGPGVGGLLGAIDLRLPLWVAAGLSFLNFLYGWFVLPESLPPERRAKVRFAAANPVGSLQMLRESPVRRALSTTAFLFYLAQYALNSVFVLYAGYRYQWSEAQVGLALMLVGVCSALVQAVLVRRVVAQIGERRALMLGTLCGISGFLVLGFATVGWVFLLALPLNSLWGLAGPASMGMLSRGVPPDEQGRLQGGLSSLAGIAGLIGPLLFTAVFAEFIGPAASLHLPGAPFVLAAALLGVALLVALPVTRPAPAKP